MTEIDDSIKNQRKINSLLKLMIQFESNLTNKCSLCFQFRKIVNSKRFLLSFSDLSSPNSITAKALHILPPLKFEH